MEEVNAGFLPKSGFLSTVWVVTGIDLSMLKAALKLVVDDGWRMQKMEARMKFEEVGINRGGHQEGAGPKLHCLY